MSLTLPAISKKSNHNNKEVGEWAPKKRQDAVYDLV
jgi:hypothetical protein